LRAEVARPAAPGQAGLAAGGCLFFAFVGVVMSPFLFGVPERAPGSDAASFGAAAAVCTATALVLLLRG
jgi:hypothetical protein